MTRSRSVDDPTRGQLQVVVSFRALPCAGWNREEFEELVRQTIRRVGPMCDQFAGLDVAVRVIGSQGEASVIEGDGP